MTGQSRDHIVSGGLTMACRVLQLILALVVVGLAAYGLVFLRFSGLELNMFTACMTVIFCVYFLLATTVFVRMYNYWAALCFDIFGFVFWLTSFSLLVNQIRPFYWNNYYYDGCDWFYYGACYYKRDLEEMGIDKRATTSFYTYRNSMGAIAAMAGLLWVVFLATLIGISMNIANHRKEGGHALYGRQATPRVNHQSKGDVEMQPSGDDHSHVSAFHQQPTVGAGHTAPVPSAPLAPMTNGAHQNTTYPTNT